MTEVDSIMSRELVSVAPGLPLQEAARQMSARHVGAALVLDEDRLAGILTERDVLRAFADQGEGAMRVADWMTANPETIEPSERTGQAAVLMIHGGFRHLPVVEGGGTVVGIVSIRDLMRLVIDDESPRGV